jgi:3-oxoacyl-[acyl-carrier protein] reductase
MAERGMTPPLFADIAGRTALVTGAAGGIGRAIVAALVREGVNVVATDLNATALESLRDAPAARAQVSVLAGDLGRPEEPERLVSRTVEMHGGIDILVNNAGCIIRRDFREADAREWELMVSVNLRAAFFLAQHASRSMSARGWGRIVNLTSQAGHTGGAADCPIYAITKGGLMTMTRALARALAPDGVTVNAIAPGIVMTEMISGTLTQAQVADLVETIPVRRPSEPAEIADAVVFLASRRAATITGHVLDINGGMVMR